MIVLSLIVAIFFVWLVTLSFVNNEDFKEVDRKFDDILTRLDNIEKEVEK